jgi:hypothetical protein
MSNSAYPEIVPLKKGHRKGDSSHGTLSRELFRRFEIPFDISYANHTNIAIATPLVRYVLSPGILLLHFWANLNKYISRIPLVYLLHEKKSIACK